VRPSLGATAFQSGGERENFPLPGAYWIGEERFGHADGRSRIL
jgi:hypothetical protein